MFIVVVICLIVITFSSMNMAMIPVEATLEHRRSEILRSDIQEIAAAVDERFEENPVGGYVAPATLAGVAGYEYLLNRSPYRFKFQSATLLNDSAWLFGRAAIWFESPHDAVGDSNYLLAANNSCGTGAFNSGGSWCGRKQSLWSKLETKNNYSLQLFGEQQRLTRTMRKFYQRYNKDQTFSSLGNGQGQTLAALAGYGGAAAACSGVFVYYEIPLGCEDMFNYWGIPVVLNRVSDNHVVLVSRTLVASASGQQIRLAEEAKLE